MAIEINSLPDELFLKIFQYTSSRDIRNCIRLVCHRWNQLADDPIFTKNELIVVNCKFKNHYCWPHKRELKRNLFYFELDRRNRPTLNLFFKNQQCDQQEKLVHTFWRICGNRVRSLIFEGCGLTYRDLRVIICWCPFVKHISLLWNNPLHSDHWIKSVPYYSMPQIQSVTSFSIQLYPSDDYELSYRATYKILTSFPNLLELKIAINGKYHFYDDTFREHREISPLTEIAHDIRTNKKKLRKLWLVQDNSISYRKKAVEFSSVLSQLENLEELTVAGHQFLLFKLRSSTALWKSLPKLTFLSLSKIPVSYDRENILLTEILEALPNLQVLHFESDRSKFFSSIFDKNLIEKVLASRLKSLHLIHYDSSFCGFDGRIQNLQLNQNHSLEELVIICKIRVLEYQKYYGLLDLILQHCKTLRHLAVSHPNDKVLQSIFKYHKSLKSLMLLRAEICSDFGFIGRNLVSRKNPRQTYSINELKDLELLTIRNMDPDRVTYRISSFLAFPKLKSWEMDFVKDCYTHTPEPHLINDLIEAVSKNTLLEALQFHAHMASDIPVNLLKQSLGSLKELRFFSLTSELENPLQQKPILDTIRSLYAVCPSLRFIVIGKKIFLRCRRPTNGFDVKEVSPSCMKFDKPREMLPSWYGLCKFKPEMWSNLDLIEFD